MTLTMDCVGQLVEFTGIFVVYGISKNAASLLNPAEVELDRYGRQTVELFFQFKSIIGI
jgi:hypothetical protein